MFRCIGIFLVSLLSIPLKKFFYCSGNVAQWEHACKTLCLLPRTTKRQTQNLQVKMIRLFSCSTLSSVAFHIQGSCSLELSWCLWQCGADLRFWMAACPAGTVSWSLSFPSCLEHCLWLSLRISPSFADSKASPEAGAGPLLTLSISVSSIIHDPNTQCSTRFLVVRELGLLVLRSSMYILSAYQKPFQKHWWFDWTVMNL